MIAAQKHIKKGKPFLEVDKLFVFRLEDFITLPLDYFFSIITGDQVLQTGGDGLDDGAPLEDEDLSPQPQGRRNRREACTCPMCKDGEPRYVTDLYGWCLG